MTFLSQKILSRNIKACDSSTFADLKKNYKTYISISHTLKTDHGKTMLQISDNCYGSTRYFVWALNIKL